MNTKVCKILGNAIADRRNAINMTQETLASHVGLNPRSIQRIEAGSEMPRYDTLFRIADILGITPDTLIMPMWDFWKDNRSEDSL